MHTWLLSSFISLQSGPTSDVALFYLLHGSPYTVRVWCARAHVFVAVACKLHGLRLRELSSVTSSYPPAHPSTFGGVLKAGPNGGQ